MDSLDLYLLAAGGLIAFSVLVSVASNRIGLPLLIIFLLAGMLAGENGPGGIPFGDFELAFRIGNIALALILLDGGLRTQISTFRVALKPAAMLASWGVLVSAGLLGGFATWLLGIDWRLGLLLGAIVASTDAAAVFSLLRNSRLRINERVRATLEIESGTNDPMAIFLVIAFIGVLRDPASFSWAHLALELVLELGIGTAAGAGGGYILALALARLRLAEGLYALLIASAGLAIFGAANAIGGSGFLAVYIAGLVIGNRRSHATEHVMTVLDGLAWLAQAIMFVLLGLLVTPARLFDSMGHALAVAFFLMLIARPLAVLTSLVFMRFRWRETVFVSWVGLRGAVPIVLAIFPVVAGLPDAHLIFDVTFTVVLVSLLLQGMTLPLAARLLGMIVPHRAEPVDRSEVWIGSRGHELVTFRVEPGAPAVGWASVEPLPLDELPGLRCLFVARGGTPLMPSPEQALAADDLVWLLLAPGQSEMLSAFFSGSALKGESAARDFYGEFTVRADAAAADLAAVYGLELNAEEAAGTIGTLLERRLGRRAVAGDGVMVGSVRIVTRDIENGRIATVGLKLMPEQ